MVKMAHNAPRRPVMVAAALLCAVALTATAGCQILRPSPSPTSSTPARPMADAVALALADALQAGDLSKLPWVGSAAAVQAEYQTVVAALDGALPSVSATTIRYDEGADTATVNLDNSYAIGVGTWTFASQAGLVYDAANGWRVRWSPSIVYPALDGNTRLSLTSNSSTRGEIRGSDGNPLVWNRPVYRVGIDKTQVSAAEAVTSARALAKLLNIDADAYAKRVQNGGAQQFVIATTLRQGEVPVGVDAIPGCLTQADTASLGPSPTWAISLLGTAGEVTAEDIQKSGGKLQVGDIIGQSGLQARYDGFLRGIPGYTVWLAPRSADTVTTPAPGATSTSGTTSASTPISQRQKIWGVDPAPGGNLILTLDPTMQTKAEDVLANQPGVAALVVLDVQTGAIRAAANSPASGANPYATFGRYAPGSTFKLATSLAAFRTGLTPDSPVDCPPTLTLGATSFKNYNGYPASGNGTITIREAVAYSCNTAMVNLSRGLPDGALADAASSLGIGIDADLGFPAFLGSVPLPDSSVLKASDAFGQGTVEASPLAMATEAASIAAGRTITPYLIEPATSTGTATTGPTDAPSSSSAEPPPANTPTPSGSQPPTALPTRSAPELTAQEAAWLQDEMQAVVKIGTGTMLKGLVTGAKSGTAEFVKDGQTLTHAWMLAYTDTYAIAAYVDEGEGGGATAAPLIRALLS